MTGRQASTRTNEFFLPGEGIIPEVITTDICRYLGNDALVRPGAYENPQTGQPQEGYFITAYRNLTVAMVADLRADSERWEAERRRRLTELASSVTSFRDSDGNVSKPNTPITDYRDSTTHQSRQYYGSTEEAIGTMGYQAATAATFQPPVHAGSPYASSSGYQSYGQQYPGYPISQGNPVSVGNYYPAGADMVADQQPSYQQSEMRNSYYSSESTASQAVTSSQYSGDLTIPDYGRPMDYNYDPYADSIDPSYTPRAPSNDPLSHEQASPMPATSAAAASSGPSSRIAAREREERDGSQQRHHRR